MKAFVVFAPLFVALVGFAADLAAPTDTHSPVVRSLLKTQRRELASPTELERLRPEDFGVLRQAFTNGDLLRQAVLAWPLARAGKEQALPVLIRAIEARTRGPIPLTGEEANYFQLLLQAVGYMGQTSEEAASYLSGLLPVDAWDAYRATGGPGDLNRLLAVFTLKAYAITGRPDVSDKISAFSTRPGVDAGNVVDAAFFDWYRKKRKKYGFDMLNDQLLAGVTMANLIPLFYSTPEGTKWKKWFDANKHR